MTQRADSRKTNLSRKEINGTEDRQWKSKHNQRPNGKTGCCRDLDSPGNFCTGDDLSFKDMKPSAGETQPGRTWGRDSRARGSHTSFPCEVSHTHCLWVIFFLNFFLMVTHLPVS